MADRIEDYALIGDCEAAALVSRGGPTLLDVRIDGEEVPPINLRMRTLGTAR